MGHEAVATFQVLVAKMCDAPQYNATGTPLQATAASFLPRGAPPATTALSYEPMPASAAFARAAVTSQSTVLEQVQRDVAELQVSLRKATEQTRMCRFKGRCRTLDCQMGHPAEWNPSSKPNVAARAAATHTAVPAAALRTAASLSTASRPLLAAALRSAAPPAVMEAPSAASRAVTPREWLTAFG